jgi:hypothetical protein
MSGWELLIWIVVLVMVLMAVRRLGSLGLIGGAVLVLLAWFIWTNPAGAATNVGHWLNNVLVFFQNL